MSGRKVSEYQLKQERELKLKALSNVKAQHAALSAVKQRIAETLKGASPGLRSTFPGEVAEAERWLKETDVPDVGKLDMSTPDSTISSMQSSLGRKAGEGRRLQEKLTVAFTKQADEIGKKLAQKLAEVEGVLLDRQELLGLWFGQEQVRAWQDQLSQAKARLEQQQYPAAESALAQLRAELVERGNTAERQEEKQQKRLYLLKALRQVCREMGFTEVEAPRYEREGDRGSRMFFTVDTVDRGKIAFALTLDGISSLSEIAEGQCFEEFGQLSKYLEDSFGIVTQFKGPDGQPIPRLLRKGEMDLPSDAGRTAEA